MSNSTYIPYKVKDISLAEWGRKEIKMAEAERTRINGLTIMEQVSSFAKKHPKIKEPSNNYK